MVSRKAFFVGAVVAVAISGCASVSRESTPEETVKARAQQRWDALVKGDYEAAYRLLSPGSRAVTSFESYLGSIRQGFWKAARVSEVQCSSADACEAGAEIEYEFRGSRVKTPLRETWIRQEGNWWYVLK